MLFPVGKQTASREYDVTRSFCRDSARKEDSKDDVIKVNQSGGTFVWRLTFATTKTVRPFHAKEIEDLCGRESVVVNNIYATLYGGSTSEGEDLSNREAGSATHALSSRATNHTLMQLERCEDKETHMHAKKKKKKKIGDNNNVTLVLARVTREKTRERSHV